MESITYFKNLRIPPKKLRFLLPEIKKLRPADTLDRLMYMPNKSAAIYYKVIKSALNNAKNLLKVDEQSLRFKLITVEQGQRLKRYKAGGRGTAKPILRKFSHIKIVLEAEEPKKETLSVKKQQALPAAQTKPTAKSNEKGEPEAKAKSRSSSKKK